MKIFKRIFLILAVASLCLGSTCNQSQQRITFNTISSMESGVDSAYKAYLDLVVTGKVSTNAVPSISQKYDLFQTAVRTSITVSTLSSNSPPSGALTAQAADILTSISAAKGGQ